MLFRLMEAQNSHYVAYVALCDAINPLLEKGVLETTPIKDEVAAISLGIKDGGLDRS